MLTCYLIDASNKNLRNFFKYKVTFWWFIFNWKELEVKALMSNKNSGINSPSEKKTKEEKICGVK